MKTLKALILATVCFSFVSATSLADGFGTKEEASALLERAVALMKIDKNRALDLFSSGVGGLIQKDLYIFCLANNGVVTAHPTLLGVNLLNFKDSDGLPLVQLMVENAKAGAVYEISYKTNRPAEEVFGQVIQMETSDEYTKTSLVTRVADQICGVGYYHPE